MNLEISEKRVWFSSTANHSLQQKTQVEKGREKERAYHNLKQLLMGIIIVMRRARGLNLRATQKMPIVPQKKHF